MDLLQAIILGIIQGLTEFLPVSSSGHIELGKALLGVHMGDDLVFSVIVHGATAMSTMVVFRKDILQILNDLVRFKRTEHSRLALLILLSMIPVAIIGLFFKDQVEGFFEGRIVMVGFMLWVTAFLLFLSEKITRSNDKPIDAPRAWWVGVAQAIAILPGISRSGATIATSLMLGVDRNRAARFSFLMVLPPIIGATILEGAEVAKMANGTGEVAIPALVGGFIAAFITGIWACRFMINIVRESRLQYFAIYCFIVGALAIGSGFI